MSKTSCYLLNVYALIGKQGSVAVTEVMNTDTFDTCQVCKLLVGLFKGRVTDRTLTAADIHIIIELRYSFLTAFVMF